MAIPIFLAILLILCYFKSNKNSPKKITGMRKNAKNDHHNEKNRQKSSPFLEFVFLVFMGNCSRYDDLTMYFFYDQNKKNRRDKSLLNSARISRQNEKKRRKLSPKWEESPKNKVWYFLIFCGWFFPFYLYFLDDSSQFGDFLLAKFLNLAI